MDQWVKAYRVCWTIQTHLYMIHGSVGHRVTFLLDGPDTIMLHGFVGTDYRARWTVLTNHIPVCYINQWVKAYRVCWTVQTPLYMQHGSVNHRVSFRLDCPDTLMLHGSVGHRVSCPLHGPDTCMLHGSQSVVSIERYIHFMLFYSGYVCHRVSYLKSLARLH